MTGADGRACDDAVTWVQVIDRAATRLRTSGHQGTRSPCGDGDRLAPARLNDLFQRLAKAANIARAAVACPLDQLIPVT